MLEAWSAKKIIFARNNSGNRAVIRDGVSGLLFDTPEQFIEQLDHVLSDKEYRNHLEQSSFEYFQPVYLIIKVFGVSRAV